jgi:hypothetical protein
MVQQLKDNIGLTTRDARAVENRRALHEDAGMTEEQAQEEAGKYADELRGKRAETIARTETTMAQAEGRNETWRLARESGELPEVERVWVSVPGFGAGGRTCEICDDLDGKTAGIDEPYDSDFADEALLRPPAHPNCRCTEILQRKEK